MTALATQIDLPGLAVHFGTVLARCVGLFLFLPIFGSALIPLRARLALATVLAATFAPLVTPVDLPAAEPLVLGLVVLRELAAGFMLGLSAKVIFAGVEAAAGLVAGQSGFALASMVDPNSGDQALAPQLFQNLLAFALFLAADLHHVFVRGALASFEILPPGPGLPEFGSLDRMTSMMGVRLFTVAVQLAAPALLVTISVDVVIGLVGRAMPQVPIIMVGYPLKMAAGLLAMALLATTTGAAIGWIGRTVASDGATLVAAIAGR